MHTCIFNSHPKEGKNIILEQRNNVQQPTKSHKTIYIIPLTTSINSVLKIIIRINIDSYYYYYCSFTLRKLHSY